MTKRLTALDSVYSRDIQIIDLTEPELCYPYIIRDMVHGRFGLGYYLRRYPRLSESQLQRLMLRAGQTVVTEMLATASPGLRAGSHLAELQLLLDTLRDMDAELSMDPSVKARDARIKVLKLMLSTFNSRSAFLQSIGKLPHLGENVDEHKFTEEFTTIVYDDEEAQDGRESGVQHRGRTGPVPEITQGEGDTEGSDTVGGCGITGSGVGTDDDTDVVTDGGGTGDSEDPAS